MEKTIQIHSVRGRAIAAALAVWMAVMIAFGVVQTVRLNRANARLDAISRKAFYETCELTESMSVNLRKLLVAGEPGQIQLLLGQIAKQAQGASGNLALLPMGEDMIAGTAGRLAKAIIRRFTSFRKTRRNSPSAWRSCWRAWKAAKSR